MEHLSFAFGDVEGRVGSQANGTEESTPESDGPPPSIRGVGFSTSWFSFRWTALERIQSQSIAYLFVATFEPGIIRRAVRILTASRSTA